VTEEDGVAPGRVEGATGAAVEPQGPPLPTRQIMSQWWRDVSFVHWRVDPDRVAPLLPPGARPDVFDGATWVGLIPFRMVDGGLGRRNAVPRLGTFLEMNVRLYSVDDAGRHGVVFRSLEAQRLGVVIGANLTFGVPYKWARMSYGARGDRVRYRSTRLTPARWSSRLEVEVANTTHEPSPLDLFLTARFGLHTRVAGRTLWVPNTHGPWPLRHARLIALDDDLVAAAGLPGVAESAPDSVLFSTGVRTVFGMPQRI
jgi:uncharacterized protein